MSYFLMLNELYSTSCIVQHMYSTYAGFLGQYCSNVPRPAARRDERHRGVELDRATFVLC